jgi:molybdopterin converting factor small subunit
MGEEGAQVKVHLPGSLAREFGVKALVPARGRTLQEAIYSLAKLSAGLDSCVLDDGGKVRRNVIVFVNRDAVTHLDPSTVALRDGDEVHVLPHVAGG